MKNFIYKSTIFGWIVPFILGIGSVVASPIKASKVNTPPTITANTISVPGGSGGIEKEIATALDGESDNLEITASNLPANITLTNIENSDGTVTALVSVGCYVSAGAYSVTLTVKDPEGASATDELTINVTANTMPVLAYAATASVNGGGSITINPTAGPSDNSNDFTVGVGDPGTFTGDIAVDPVTGVITITNAAPVGTHQITMKISETCEFEETATFELTVNNNNPTILGTTIGRQQGTLTGLNATIATVNDVETAVGSLSVTVITPLPSGISISGITNVNGTINANVRASCFAAIGENTVGLRVTDGNGGTATANLIVNVTENLLPTITYGNQTVNMMGGLTVNPASGPSDNGEFGAIKITDPDGYTGDIDVDSNTGEISISNAAPLGTHTITVRIMDNCEVTNTTTFTLTVTNASPTIQGTVISRQQGSAETVSTIANVDDTETAKGSLTVTATTVPMGISVSNITNTNGVISAMVSAGCYTNIGENTVVLTVMDEDGGTATANLIVNVTANSLPILSYANSTVSVAGSTTINPATGPADNGTYGGLTIEDKGTFTGDISIDPTTAVLSVSNAAPLGVHTITVKIYDNCEEYTETSFTLTVEGCTSTLTAGAVTNPTTCTSPVGSIAFTTNLPDGDYTLNFTSSAGATTSPQPVKVAGGAFSLGGLLAGTYSNFSITSLGCTASAMSSKVITAKTPPTATLAGGGEACQQSSAPLLTFTATNGSAPYRFGYRINGGSVLYLESANAVATLAPSTQVAGVFIYTLESVSDGNGCSQAQSGSAKLTVNYRAAVPQNVSLSVDGVTVAVGETKEVCSLSSGTPLTFNATCAVGEIVLHSVDGGEYSVVIPVALVDNQFHNYRVRCRKSDGTPSCIESESGVMRLKLIAIPSTPTASLSPERSCNPAANFSGQSTCGSLRTIWYNATTDVALPSLPSTVPTATTSYYARCQTDNGCVSEKSNVVTFTLIPTHIAPVITASQEIVCTGMTVKVSANCPAGSTTFWNTGVTTPSFEVSFNNITKQTYWAKCLFEGGCQSLESIHKNVYWDAFVVTLINVGQSKSATKPTNNRSEWELQFLTRDGGPDLVASTQQNPTLYFVENPNKTAPRYWTVNADACALGTEGSLTFDLSATPETGVIQSYNTHENTAPYFMYANREGWTELYSPNHPAFGFYLDNGAGGNVYDAGLPKGLYKLGVRYWDQKGLGLYPATRKPQGNVLAYHEYWFRIQSKDGVGVGAARTAESSGQGAIGKWQEAKSKGQGSDNEKQLTDNGSFASVMPNPVTQMLRLQIQNSKGQVVQTTLLDAAGRQVLGRRFEPETNTHQEEFGVSELPTGMYFMKVTTSEKSVLLKVVKL
ncbi:T9SS type A sorting domain-containing protein [Runella sp. SP2]|uniref:T9SS type A sorting domain-containing protein n=1 Tax=Runella sp. SP2 TaxID=2268026 RepID=UPI000F08AEF8|nr:T9SS type A sorting domain-containing protein [Runella sp. SP2]AYQ33254.1 T9SS C-terminal target domain-containing protein [Runella sp. SP2]